MPEMRKRNPLENCILIFYIGFKTDFEISIYALQRLMCINLTISILKSTKAAVYHPRSKGKFVVSKFIWIFKWLVLTFWKFIIIIVWHWQTHFPSHYFSITFPKIIKKFRTKKTFFWKIHFKKSASCVRALVISWTVSRFHLQVLSTYNFSLCAF